MGMMLASPVIREVKVLEMKKATPRARGWGGGAGATLVPGRQPGKEDGRPLEGD